MAGFGSGKTCLNRGRRVEPSTKGTTTKRGSSLYSNHPQRTNPPIRLIQDCKCNECAIDLVMNEVEDDEE
jgi:hypothetical protein